MLPKIFNSISFGGKFLSQNLETSFFPIQGANERKKDFVCSGVGVGVVVVVEVDDARVLPLTPQTVRGCET